MLVAAHTDIGIKKPVNQDSLIVRESKLQDGSDIMFAAVCDGMGGLSNGEIASKEAVNTITRWFDEKLPGLLQDGLTNNSLRGSLNEYILEVDEKLNIFSDEEGACGTTLAGLFLFNGRYACVNVGDSRVYHLHKNEIFQITHDQTVTQKEIDAGRMTEAEAAKDKRRSILLQCIGAGGDVVPVYKFGIYAKGDVFLICSDGFRHKLKLGEIARMFRPDSMTNEEIMKSVAEEAVEINKERKERDNISVIAIKV